MFKIDAFASALLGIAFVVLGTATTFLMFWLWGFPFDKATRKSAAPRSLMLLHRGLGFAYAGLYVFMMFQMVPRLFAYQVEFPPRTVAHIGLGITIGFILMIKIAIIRFFRHLEEWMPVLGVLLLLCTYLLLGLSVPFTFRERLLAQRSDAFSTKNLERVGMQLGESGLPKEAPLAELATTKGLLRGREVLLTKCVGCHDLRTVLTRPRTPSDWSRTVERMAERPVIGEVIDEPEQWAVTAYLIAISPELQNASRSAKKLKDAKSEARVAGKNAQDAGAQASFVLEDVKPKYELLCSQCHELDDVEGYAWTDEKDLSEVMSRMLDNGLEASPEDVAGVEWYLKEKYLK